jgi:FMN phosphatase YigB (HAD superfamily)
MNAPSDVIFLLDVDNTLLDNDRIVADLDDYLAQALGDRNRQRYWKIFDTMRDDLGYADYLGALQRVRIGELSDSRLLSISSFLLDYPFATRLYPGALDVIDHLAQWGTTVILSDGDIVFQPRKIQRSGLWDAVEGKVLIYRHKELMLEDVQGHYPAHHFVMVDDKLKILHATKLAWGDRVTTVFPRQGHYALEARNLHGYPAADISIDRISDLIAMDYSALLGSLDRQGSLERASY